MINNIGIYQCSNSRCSLHYNTPCSGTRCENAGNAFCTTSTCLLNAEDLYNVIAASHLKTDFDLNCSSCTLGSARLVDIHKLTCCVGMEISSHKN